MKNRSGSFSVKNSIICFDRFTVEPSGIELLSSKSVRVDEIRLKSGVILSLLDSHNKNSVLDIIPEETFGVGLEYGYSSRKEISSLTVFSFPNNRIGDGLFFISGFF